MSEAQRLLWEQMLAKSFDPIRWWWDSEIKPVRDAEEVLAPDTRETKDMWVYRYVREGRYEVGYWSPEKKWFCDSVCSDATSAAQRVHYLMGGERQ